MNAEKETGTPETPFDFLPASARQLFDDGVEWIRENPTEAALASAVGGLLLGLTGVGRIAKGVHALRSMPVVSQFLLGVVAQGIAARGAGKRAADAVH